MLLEDVEHLVLTHQCSELRRVLARGYAQQQTVVVLLYTEECELRRVDEHRAVEVVDEALYIIICSVELTRSAQQHRLRLIAEPLKEAYRLVGRYLVATYLQTAVDETLHLAAYLVYVSRGNGATQAQVAVVAVAHWNVDDDVALRKQLVHRLAEYEEERACIGADARRRRYVQILNVLRVVHTIMQSFDLVVYLCAHRRVRHLHIKLRKNVRKCTSCCYFQSFFIIFATDLYHLFHLAKAFKGFT